WELLLPGVLGATQVMLRPGAESEPAAIRDTVRRHGVTAIHFVPSMLAQYLTAVDDGFAGVRRCVCSGEELDTELAQRFLAAAGPTTLHNYYGPTEATVDVTALRVDGGPVTIGRPVPNTRLYVLDEAGAPCPVGVDGELCIAGTQVGRGYLNRPELTAARFTGDPFRAGQRMYRTGDIARWLPNGELAYRGRRDGQVKIRGYRIELAEIEQSLREQPGVDAAVVLAQRDPTGGAHLYAYVHGPDCPPAETLRDALLRRLPAYMMPARYHEVATIPVTSNGKVDRAALAARSGAVATTPEYMAPRDETEQALLDIWQALLPAGRIGTTDDFFVIGGHSLSALQLSSRISRRFGVRVTSAAVFTHRTIGEQAQLIAELPADVETPVVPGIRRDRHDLSPAQQRVWFLQTLDPDSSAYNIRTLAKLHGTLDVTALRQAAGALVQRHEMLRVTFTDVGGHVHQTPHPVVTPAFDVRDLRHLDLDSARTAAERGVRDADSVPFRLRDETPLRLMLFRVTDTEHHLLVTLHHIAGDGWSMRLLMRELSVLYQRFRGEPNDLPDLRTQYIDHVEAMRDPAHQAASEDDLRYWVERLSGAESLELPTDAPVLDTGSGRASVVVPPRVRCGLIDLADTTATTPFEVTMTALTVLLSRLSDQQDVVVGFPVANRPGVDLEHIVGLFLNTLVLRADLSGAPSFVELLRQVSGRVREAYDHQAAPFELLVERLNPVRRLDRTPIFDVLLNYLGDLREEISIDGVSVEFEDRLFEPAAKFPLTLYVSDEGDGMRIDAVYRPDLFSAARIDELLRQFAALLDQAVRVAERPVTAYSLAAPGAADLTTALSAPELPPLPDLIGAHAAGTPEQVAIVAGLSAITYAELWERSARVARCLVAAGCRPGDVVGVTGPRGVGFVVGLLGALRAGAVILPLDPQLPAGRRDHLLSAGKPVMFVTVSPDTVDDESAGPLLPKGFPAIEIEECSGSLVAQTDPVVKLPDVTPQSAAYAFFTSGTTGTPRGVLGWHGALSHFLLWQKERFGIGPGDRCAQLTSASFDVMLRDTFLALVAGGTVVVPEPQDTVGGKAVFTWLDQQGVTVLHAAPTIMRSWLLDAPTGARLPALRWTFLAGEPLTPELVTTMRTTFPDSGEIVNLYGPTETTMAKFAYHVPHGPLPAVLPVGSPLPQCQVVLLRGDVPCGIGEPGEIVIRTPFRTRGYLDEPVTAAFVRNPHRDDDSDLLYRTGDIGRLRPDGLLEVIGRVDHQVKINGVRVHPAEVATALGRHPRVSACVVVAHKGSDAGDRLVAYVVADEPGPDIAADVRAYLGYHLPRAMVPAQVIRLDRIPTNANGKPDRAALPVPDWQPDVPVAAGPAPRDAVEQSIQDIWRTVLDRPVPDVHSDFFVLGGTSLMLLRLFALLDEAFPGTFRVAQLFASPTVAGQARLVAPAPAPIENEVVEHEF
ncbi:MAG TPA: amino acid adenylation domain-containing protein, partial [Pseudonocardiaceae bacterium]